MMIAASLPCVLLAGGDWHGFTILALWGSTPNKQGSNTMGKLVKKEFDLRCFYLESCPCQ